MDRASRPSLALLATVSAALLGAGCTGVLDSAEPERSSSVPPVPGEDAGSSGTDAGPGGADAARPGDTGSKGADAAPGADTRVAVDGAPGADSAPLGSDAGPAPDATPPPPPPTGGYLVAYYANWTTGTMPVKTIPWSKMTHVAHAFVLPSATGGLRDVSSYVDATLITEAHAHGVKVVASVGGAGANFDANVDPAVRALTVSALASLCKTNGYDGIDLDWEFPDATTGPAWSALIAELRVALDAIDPALTISAAVASGAWNGQHLPSDGLSKLSWVGVMTYDYAGAWSATSGHDSPLFPSKGGDGGSVSESVDYYLGKRGLPADRVLLGLPFYGAQFGSNAIASTPVAPSASPDYRDVVASIAGAEGWTKGWDDGAKVPFLTRAASPGFLSYDDEKSIGAKCAYGKSKALRGAIVWHLAGDRLPDGTNPLLDAAQPCR